MANLNAALGFGAHNIDAELQLERERRRREQMYLQAASQAAGELGKAAASAVAGGIGGAISLGEKAVGTAYGLHKELQQRKDAREQRDYQRGRDEKYDARQEAAALRQKEQHDFTLGTKKDAAAFAKAEGAIDQAARYAGTGSEAQQAAASIAAEYNLPENQVRMAIAKRGQELLNKDEAAELAERRLSNEERRLGLVEDAQADRADEQAARGNLAYDQMEFEREKLEQRRREMEARGKRGARGKRAAPGKHDGATNGFGAGKAVIPIDQRTDKMFTKAYEDAQKRVNKKSAPGLPAVMFQNRDKALRYWRTDPNFTYQGMWDILTSGKLAPQSDPGDAAGAGVYGPQTHDWDFPPEGGDTSSEDIQAEIDAFNAGGVSPSNKPGARVQDNRSELRQHMEGPVATDQASQDTIRLRAEKLSNLGANAYPVAKAISDLQVTDPRKANEAGRLALAAKNARTYEQRQVILQKFWALVQGKPQPRVIKHRGGMPRGGGGLPADIPTPSMGHGRIDPNAPGYFGR